MGVRTPSYKAGFYAPERGGRAAYPQLWRGCVGAWNPGLGPSGLVLRDWGGRKNNGVLTNGPVWSTSTGRQAISADGVNDDIISDRSSGLSGDVTASMSVWIYRTGAFEGLAVMTGNSAITLGGMSIDTNVNGPGTVSAEFFGSNGYRVTSSVITANAWVHVAVTKTKGPINTTTALYVNGVERTASSASVNTPSVINAQVRIGSYQSGGFFAGQIADVRIYDRVVLANEINLLARRPGIAYELAPRKFYSLPTPSFSAAWARRQSIIIGGGLH